MNPAAEPALLQATGIGKSFPGVRALNDMRLTIRAGTVTALIGENGAGKSTLMNILSGVFGPDEGEIRIEGELVSIPDVRSAAELGISIIHQELNLITDMTIAENIFLGREPQNGIGLIDFPRMNEEAAALLERLRLDRKPNVRIRDLRVGEQQIVEIAKALSLQSRILFMDEPTSAISDNEVEVLFDIIKSLTNDGVGIVYVTHKMDEVFRICDHATVLRDGEFVGEVSLESVTREHIVEMMVGRELQTHARNAAPALGQEALRVENLASKGGRDGVVPFLQDISFNVRQGEVVGIFGLMGSGRTELLETLFGAHPLTAGRIVVDNAPVRLKSPRDAIEAGIGLAPEDRKSDGLILSMSVSENITLAACERILRLCMIDRKKEAALAGESVSKLRIKAPGLSSEIRTLSGGNQQKAVLGKWLTRKPKVLLLDEPTRGIDVNAKREIYSVIQSLAVEGMGVLFASSELPEVLMLADRILVLSEGRMAGEFSAQEATEEILLHAALPVAVGSATRNSI